MDKNIIKTFNLLKNSYSPYSKFRVACSIIMKDNTFIKGVNVEKYMYSTNEWPSNTLCTPYDVYNPNV